jgi:hypothetical protein
MAIFTDFSSKSIGSSAASITRRIQEAERKTVKIYRLVEPRGDLLT